MAEQASRAHTPGARPRARRAGVAKTADSADGEKAASSGWLASLAKRATSALILIPVVIALVWFGGWMAFVGALLTLLVATWELHDMFAHKGWHPPVVFSLALCIDFLVVAILWNEHVSRLALVAAVLLGICALLTISFGWLILTRENFEAALLDWALAMATPFYLGLPLSFFLLLRGNVLGASAPGFAWMLATFFMVWANDTFALLAGHYLGRGGRHKLAPRVSPAKTWEGFFGGLVFTVIAALVFLIAIPNIFNLAIHVAWYHAAAIGILVAVAATIGDLAESLLKRGTNVKDSGKIIPGHGGILDRIDSLLFAVLVVVFYAAFLHGIPL
ncbi:MAG TPA: CDP-archaeol synthase [Ktedonobacterales bacterium]|nr:CDP-archaeol synthase [Ktedonobacterales bacterium]